MRSSVSRLRHDLHVVRNSAQALDRVFGDAPAVAAIDTTPHPFDFDPTSLTTMQQCAMMQQHLSYFNRMIVRAILEDAQDKPTLSDHHALVELGLSHKKSIADKWHSLTMPGIIAAKKIEPHLAKQFDVHAMAGPHGEGHSVSFYCPCGWSTSVRNSHTARGNASVSWRNHHATEKGLARLKAALKPPGMEGA